MAKWHGWGKSPTQLAEEKAEKELAEARESVRSIEQEIMAGSMDLGLLAMRKLKAAHAEAVKKVRKLEKKLHREDVK